MATDLISRLAGRAISKEELDSALEADPELIPVVVGGLGSPSAPVRYGCARALIEISERHPERLYRHWGAFEELLGGRYRILTWGAIVILANLSAVDSAGRLEAAFEKYFSLLGDGYMVTVANVVGSSPKVARAKPHLADRIAVRILGVETLPAGPHMTEECKRVVAEKAVEALGSFYDLLGPATRERVKVFVARQGGSGRASLAEAAREFLEKNA